MWRKSGQDKDDSLVKIRHPQNKIGGDAPLELTLQDFFFGILERLSECGQSKVNRRAQSCDYTEGIGVPCRDFAECFCQHVQTD